MQFPDALATRAPGVPRPPDRRAADPDPSIGAVAGATAARRAEDSLGVRVTGYMSHVLGLGSAARGYARALAAAGVEVSTVTRRPGSCRSADASGRRLRAPQLRRAGDRRRSWFRAGVRQPRRAARVCRAASARTISAVRGSVSGAGRSTPFRPGGRARSRWSTRSGCTRASSPRTSARSRPSR